MAGLRDLTRFRNAFSGSDLDEEDEDLGFLDKDEDSTGSSVPEFGDRPSFG